MDPFEFLISTRRSRLLMIVPVSDAESFRAIWRRFQSCQLQGHCPSFVLLRLRSVHQIEPCFREQIMGLSRPLRSRSRAHCVSRDLLLDPWDIDLFHVTECIQCILQHKISSRRSQRSSFDERFSDTYIVSRNLAHHRRCDVHSLRTPQQTTCSVFFDVFLFVSPRDVSNKQICLFYKVDKLWRSANSSTSNRRIFVVFVMVWNATCCNCVFHSKRSSCNKVWFFCSET